MINREKCPERAEIGAAYLKKFLEGYGIPEITASTIKDSVEKRLEEGASNSTINRELDVNPVKS